MKKGMRYIWITLAGILAICIVVAVCCLMPFFNQIMALRDEAKAIVKAGSIQDFSEIRTSIVYDCNGEVLMTYSGEKDLYYVEIGQIPQVLQDAFVVMEDKKYYSHKGVDVMAVVRSAIANYKANEIVQGASTITQQLARNIYLNQDVNWQRKIKEAFIALELEKKYSKEQILEFYLNNIYFGNGYYGIEAAAKGYFDKSVSELTLGECIFLSAIPNNPSRYDPLSHEENTVGRARLILLQLYSEGKVSDLDYLLLSEDEGNPFVPNFSTDKERVELNKNTADSYIYTYVTYCATRYLMEQNGFYFKNNFTNEEELESYDASYDTWYTFYQQKLFTEGYRIYTSIDPAAQKKLQETVDKVIAENDSAYAAGGTSENPLQASAVTIDNETGKVVAIVGGRNENVAGYGFNRAYQSFRQPGSSIKPLNVYGPYLSRNHSTEETVYDIYDPNGPKNAGGVYSEKITLRDAIKSSKNTIAWQIYKYLTPSVGSEYLLRLGFKKIYMDKDYMSAALGGFTYGVSAEEMTAGFRTICNDGVYNAPTCICAMYRDSQEPVEYNSEDVRIYSENGARLLTSALTSVIEEGTGKKAQMTAHTAAGKTGTTNKNKDMWFIGYTTYYTTGVWVGYDSPKEISMDNGNLAVTIWHDYMENLHIGLMPKSFVEGNYVQPVENRELTTLQAMLYEALEGEPALENIWDNDIDADTVVLGGDTDATITGGDSNATITGGDSNATITGGDSNATITGGDSNATITGGDSNATITGGDGNATITGGDSNATITHVPGDTG